VIYNQTDMDTVYLDNNATTQPAPEVVDAVTRAMREQWANPSSVHRFGQLARQKVELARQQVARLIGAQPRDLVFTSGATESNNLAIRGLLDLGSPNSSETKPTLVTTKIEHSAVREPAAALAAGGGRAVYVPVDRDGRVSPADVAEAVSAHAPDAGVLLVSIQWANNETGVVQPIEQIAEAVAEARDGHTRLSEYGRVARVWFHVDGTQAVGKLPVDVKAAGVDLMTAAAHKLHGPKGVGVLYRRSGVRLRAQQRGGPQERELRGGTEHTPGIIGFGVAAELAEAFVQDSEAVARVAGLRDRLEQGICAALPDTLVNSAGAPRLPNTTNLGFPGLEAEAILVGLSERGVCASAGAACSSGSLDPSPVLLAMGVPEPVAHGSVRFSLSRFTTDAQIDRALEAVPAVVGRLRKTMPV